MDTAQQPFLTIGIASYNYARYLPRAFAAIRRQTFTDYELLYADDGSTDESVAVIQTLIRDNPDMTIRLVQGENGGVMANKNRILDHARGRYVMLCDADDWMDDDCLSVLCGKAIQTDADQVASAFRLVDDEGHVQQVQEIPANPIKWTWGAHHATLYKREVIEMNHLRLDENCYPDDVYFNTIFHEHSGSMAFAQQVTYNWFVHATSTSACTSCTDLWHGSPMLTSALSYLKAAYNNAKTAEDREQIEYMAIKVYGLAIFYRHAGTSFKAYYADYQNSHAIMRTEFPDYTQNRAARRSDGRGYVRMRTAQIIHATMNLERIHVFPVALLGYWLSSHVKEFGI